MPAEHQSESTFDRNEALRRLDGNVKLLDRIIKLLLKSAPGQIDTIAAALAAGDLETVVREAHTLKSSAGYLGATRLVATASALEHTARAGNAATAKDLAGTLALEYERFAKSLPNDGQSTN